MKPESGWEGLKSRVDRKLTCNIVGCRWSYSTHVGQEDSGDFPGKNC